MADTSDLTLEEVTHVAKLANLQLGDDELKLYMKQLSDVLHYVEQLQGIDTTDVPETAQVTGLHTVTRTVDGAGTRTLRPDIAVSQAKKSHNNYVVVPAILENRD